MGANDGASGVSVLLELARLLKQNPPPIGIDIVLFDGEDYGKEGDLDRYCLGSKFFATNKKVDYNPIFGILLDMVGDRNLRMPKEGYSVQYAPDIVDLIWSVASEKGITQFLDEVSAPVYDDHRSLNLIGIKTVDLIDADLVGNHGTNEGRKYWHTRQDTPDKCSVESLEAIGRVLAHIVYAKVDA
jgi:Zn-dependent M28 family amino/carboxypeptidase